MYVSYPEAARSKLCSVSDVEDAVNAGELTGDDVFVVWDDDFHVWSPPVSTQRVVSALNARRFDSKSIRAAVSSRPVPEVHEITSRECKTLGGYDWFVIPVTMENLHLLLGLHDGYHDAFPFEERRLDELSVQVQRGEYVYQRRIGLTAEHYSGKNLFPSQVATLASASSMTGKPESDVMEAVADGTLRASPFNGDLVIHLDRDYEQWIDSAIATMRFAGKETDVMRLGIEFDSAFWDLSE